MIRSLMKGHSSVYLQYTHNGDNIGAERYEAEIVNGMAVLRFTLRPIDGNQRDDEQNLHSEELLSIQIDDEYVIDNLSKFLKLHAKETTEMRLEILSLGKTLQFSVTPGVSAIGGLSLLVKRIIS